MSVTSSTFDIYTKKFVLNHKLLFICCVIFSFVIISTLRHLISQPAKFN